MHAGQSRGVDCMSGDAGAFCECEVMTPDRTAMQVRSSGWGRSS